MNGYYRKSLYKSSPSQLPSVSVKRIQTQCQIYRSESFFLTLIELHEYVEKISRDSDYILHNLVSSAGTKTRENAHNEQKTGLTRAQRSAV